MEDKEYLKNILIELAKEMPYKWRVQSFSKKQPTATCVAYIDARDLMDRLDEICVYGWDRDHREIKGHIYAGIGIWMPSGRVQWRWDCGTESNQDKEKGESSDSFKRAGVNWKVGRFLYDKKIEYVDANEIKKTDNSGKPLNWPYVVDKQKNRVWDLTKFINDKNKSGNREPDKTSAKIERNWIKELEVASTLEELRSIFAEAYPATKGEEKAKVKMAYDKKKIEFEGE